MSYEFQELRFDEGQLYTTLLGRPESVAATTLDLDAEQVDLPLISEIVKRFNAHLQLVALLKDYVEDDENNGMDETDLSCEARALLTELGELGELDN